MFVYIAYLTYSEKSSCFLTFVTKLLFGFFGSMLFVAYVLV